MVFILDEVRWRLDVAQVNGFPQRRQWIARGNELVGHVAREVEIGDSPHHPLPLDSWGCVEFVTSGTPSGMEVPKPLYVGANGVDEIPFHDLHVVDVVEQLDARRVYLADNAHAPGGVVAHV